MAMGPLRALGYSPYENLEDRPHVMVDGAPRRSTVLTLSHWPQTPTPPALARDLSVEIVLELLSYQAGTKSAGSGSRLAVVQALAAARSAEAVTNDHFDEDGLMSVLAMMQPATALDCEQLMIGVAACGDFGVVSSPKAAAVSFAIGPLAEAEAGAGAGTAERYLAVLPRVEDLLARPESYEALWGTEMAWFDEGRAALARGEVEITEDGADLAVVSRPGAEATRSRLPGAAGGLPVHAAVVHTATQKSRILSFDGERCELYLRYESWVRVVSRRVPLRPDLGPLAAELTSLEPGPTLWEANAVGAIVGRLRPGGEGFTELAPEVVVERVRSYLAKAPPAFDPFRPPLGETRALLGSALGDRVVGSAGRPRRRRAGKAPKRGGQR
ncbi:MAG: DUF6687 family protein [Acidimicrobiales bacterium]